MGSSQEQPAVHDPEKSPSAFVFEAALTESSEASYDPFASALKYSNSLPDSPDKNPGNEPYPARSTTSFDSFIQERITSVISPPPLRINAHFAAFRYGLVTVYRLLFSVVFGANLIAFIFILIRNRTAKAALTAGLANCAVCGVTRVPEVVNTMYMISCSIPRSAPLFLRRIAAKISHYGGVHSGSGIATLCWGICYISLLTRDYLTSEGFRRPSIAVLVLAYLVVCTLIVTIGVAYPTFRFNRHDTFEMFHRFSGWIVLILFWASHIKASYDVSKVAQTSTGAFMVKEAVFWFALILTVSMIIPWLTLRRVRVFPEYLSEHAVRLHFHYRRTQFSQGIAVSDHWVGAWHGFAGIPEKSGPGFSVIITRAGDWTSRCIRNPPNHLWKRGVPVYGYGRAISLFRRVLIVVTGSGIGPCLSLLESTDRPPLRIIWQTRNPWQTYGSQILDAVGQIDPQAIIIDSDMYGQQDMMGVSWSLACEFEAEAVFVIARPDVVKQICFGFEARGVPAYGPVFDS